jgi:hypothetical protein
MAMCPDCREQLRNLWGQIRAHCVDGSPAAEVTFTPEDALLEAGISSKRQAKYQRRMSSLLAGREG